MGMNGFQKYLILRVLSLIPTIFGVVVITFILSHVIPGNPALIVVGPEPNPAEIKIAEAEMGLNLPIWQQFFVYVSQLAHFNFGYSYILDNPVSYEVGQHFPATIELALASLIISVPLAIVSGVYASLRPNKLGDHAVRVLSLLGLSIPVFFLGTVMILVFYVDLGIFPAPLGQIGTQFTPPIHITGLYILDSLLTFNFPVFVNALWHIVLPALALALGGIAALSRVLRSSMLEVLNKDYMRTVFAIGLPRKIIIRKYAFRNALLPSITVAAVQTGALMSGVVLTETVFSWPGLGLLSFDSILMLDYPTIMAVILISGILFALFNFVADILYAYIDPRVGL